MLCPVAPAQRSLRGSWHCAECLLRAALVRQRSCDTKQKRPDLHYGPRLVVALNGWGSVDLLPESRNDTTDDRHHLGCCNAEQRIREAQPGLLDLAAQPAFVRREPAHY